MISDIMQPIQLIKYSELCKSDQKKLGKITMNDEIVKCNEN